MSDAKILMLPLHKITVDLTISARAALPATVIEDYAEAIRRGEEMPPVVGFRSGDTTWIADGFLRHAAYLAAGRSSIPIEVRVGGWREARMYAAGANCRHALQRTGACKRLAAKLRQEFPQLPLCLSGDALFACGEGFQIAKDYKLSYYPGPIDHQ